jgi:Putative Flp pilus-assembly TadE/G-like
MTSKLAMTSRRTNARRRVFDRNKFLRHFVRDTHGGVLVYTAFALPILLGVCGLSVDASTWYAAKRVSQAAADAGALAAALEVVRLEKADENYVASESELKAVATAAAGENGYDAGDGDGIEVNYPPKSGPYAGTAGAVEVIVRQPASVFLARLVMARDGITVAGRAVAVGGYKAECVYALGETGSVVTASGGAQVNLPCGIAANSSDDAALVTNGGACITSSGIKVVGGMSGDCIQPSTAAKTRRFTDPFAGMAPPSGLGGCEHNKKINAKNGDNVTLQPGVYCGGISVSGGALTFEPGQYVFDGSGLSVTGGAVSGSEVSFYISPDSGQGDNISISSSSAVNLSAPTGGEMEGVLFYQDRASPTNITHTITGQANTSLQGILYFPNQQLNFSGGSSTNPVSSIIVADKIKFTGQTNIGDPSAVTVAPTKYMIKVTLVE